MTCNWFIKDRHPTSPETREQSIEKFWAFVDKDGPGGCWLWKSYRNERGYGLMSFGGRSNVRAHRISWELKHGPTPSHRFCLHKCHVRHCVNPDHLYLGSYRENARDMVQAGRHQHGERVKGGRHHDGAKLTEAQVKDIFSRYSCPAPRQGNGCALAREYGVTQSAVQAIVAGRTWKHLGLGRHPDHRRFE